MVAKKKDEHLKSNNILMLKPSHFILFNINNVDLRILSCTIKYPKMN